jgi:hypothetical protein
MALTAGSSAIDAGDDSVLGPPDSLTTDQRGLPRKSGPHVDVGAFEFQVPHPPPMAGTVSGVAFIDVNASTARDPGEPGVAGLTVFLDANGNGSLDPGEPSAVTGPDGSFSITAPTGVYVLMADVLPDHGLIYSGTAAQRTVTVAGGLSVRADLGVVPISEVIPPARSITDLYAPHPNPDSETAFVEGVYQAVLGRPADPVGLAIYVPGLKSHLLSRQQVVDAIFNSDEHHRQEVDSFDRTFLRREADAPGRAGYVAQLNAGVSEEVVALLFLISPEYNALHPDAGSFVDAAFLDVLGRAPSAEERARDVGLAGQTRAGYAQSVIHSPESLRRAVTSYYYVFLHRAPDDAGLAGHLATVQAGQLDLADVARQFLGSPEFFGNAGAAVP